jgi:4a-hydroxytetrahydrobiopterin dehydratase
MMNRMSEAALDESLSRTDASAAVADIGWRYLLGTLRVSVPVRSLAQASELAAAAVAASGPDADDHLRVDLRPGSAELSVQTAALAEVTGRDVQLAHDEAEARVRAGIEAGGRLVDDS